MRNELLFRERLFHFKNTLGCQVYLHPYSLQPADLTILGLARTAKTVLTAAPTLEHSEARLTPSSFKAVVRRKSNQAAWSARLNVRFRSSTFVAGNDNDFSDGSPRAAIPIPSMPSHRRSASDTNPQRSGDGRPLDSFTDRDRQKWLGVTRKMVRVWTCRIGSRVDLSVLGPERHRKNWRKTPAVAAA